MYSPADFKGLAINVLWCLWSLVLMFQGNGLDFWVSVFQKTEKQGKKSASVLLESPVHCCDPLVASFCSLWATFELLCLQRPRNTSSVTYQLWSLHYMQITTPASVFIVELRSNTGLWARSIVRSDRPALGERVPEFSPQPGSLAVQKMKCHADDSHCQNRNYSETLWWNNLKLIWQKLTHEKPEQHHLKGSLKSLLFYNFWLILYIIFSQILFSVLYKTARIVNMINS